MTTPENEDFDLGIEVITLTFRDGDVPDVDLGDCSPMQAYSALTAALQTVNLLIPHCEISANGKAVLSVVDLSDEDDG